MLVLCLCLNCPPGLKKTHKKTDGRQGHSGRKMKQTDREDRKSTVKTGLPPAD